MTAPVSRRRLLLLLASAPAVAALTGCGGDSSNIAVLEDQGPIKNTQRRSGDQKPKKGMDRDGS